METISFRALLVLRALCREYSRALAAGDPAPEAFFGLATVEKRLPRMKRDQLRLSLMELTSAGFVAAISGDDEAQLYVLTTSGRAAGRRIVRHAVQALLSLLKTILPWAQ